MRVRPAKTGKPATVVAAPRTRGGTVTPGGRRKTVGSNAMPRPNTKVSRNRSSRGSVYANRMRPTGKVR